MRAILPLLLGLLLAAPIAAADEDDADCEEDQPWLVGERSIAYPPLAALRATTPLALALCEGEQWDGQDPIHDEPAACTGTVHTDEVVVGYCMGADPNNGPSADALQPLGARASSNGENEAYAAANVGYVSRAATYAGVCAAGDAGLEGDAECAGSGEVRVGVYWRDNTPGNVVWQLTPQCLFSITGCNASENDCAHATYRWEQITGERWYCGRDNTALGVGLVLP